MIIPLFPLNTVLFPGGRLPLRIFEQRYMDMATACLRDESAFGVCLIASGEEVARAGLPAAEPHAVGTLAHIAEWDMAQLGVLEIVAEGGSRFRIQRQWVEKSGLLRAEVEVIDAASATPIPGAYSRLVPTLRTAIAELDAEGQGPAKPYRFFDAGWLGMRYAELLPIPAAARQRLLEVDDAVDRLEIIYRFLAGKDMLPND